MAVVYKIGSDFFDLRQFHFRSIYILNVISVHVGIACLKYNKRFDDDINA